ncbi:sensor domain-containing diguanylate cyclase [Aliirhizobium smilacinae]|uniref:Diguanylate cyclase n=1 Tax=Aliirhizobium smilacinae TaxID=1395944 RepID=A0A5C4XK95_9HYPH|nr:diguanylate cyclase [Rhizobium smilacinae]TNM63892.1 diguanylate cyclase [Rhizobium smilacinae]
MRFIHFRLVGPVIIAVAILIAGMAAIPYFGIAQIDADLRQRQETLVKHNIDLWISDIEFSLTAWTIWDESIAKIDNSFDFEWTDRNIGASLIGTSRTRFAAVLDHDDRLIYSRTDDSIKDRGFFTRGVPTVIEDAAALVANVRSREPGRIIEGIPKPVSISRIEVLGDDAVLMTAALFQPDFSTAKPKGARAPILITAMPITGTIQEFFGTRFLLDDARIGSLAGITPDRGHVEIAVGPNGEPQVLSWRPPSPAADLLYRSLPLLVTVGLLLLATGIFTVRMSRNAARTLLSREKRMRHAATHDFLTGLANRALLEPEFRSLSERGPLAVICLDLDGFKSVNDTYGHAMGDDLLKTVSARLRANTRETDRLFRLGGDEFAILMPEVSAIQAEGICQDLSISLARPMGLSKGDVSIGASFGIKLVEKGETSCDAALGAADAALYHAKASARGSSVLSSNLPPARPEALASIPTAIRRSA